MGKDVVSLVFNGLTSKQVTKVKKHRDRIDRNCEEKGIKMEKMKCERPLTLSSQPTSEKKKEESCTSCGKIFFVGIRAEYCGHMACSTGECFNHFIHEKKMGCKFCYNLLSRFYDMFVEKGYVGLL